MTRVFSKILICNLQSSIFLKIQENISNLHQGSLIQKTKELNPCSIFAISTENELNIFLKNIS